MKCHNKYSWEKYLHRETDIEYKNKELFKKSETDHAVFEAGLWKFNEILIISRSVGT